MKYLTLLFLACILIGCQPPAPENPYLTNGDGLVDVKGGKVWYGIIGEGNAAPILCLHGGPGGTSQRQMGLAPLADERPIIVMDQLGSGFSSFHEDSTLLTVENFVEQVRAIRDGLGLNEFYLSGHSWGTALALEYYSAYPEGVKGIIFNSPYFSTSNWIADTDILVSTLPDSIQEVILIAERDKVFDTEEYTQANAYFFKEYLVRTPMDQVVTPPYSLVNPSQDTTDVTGNSFIYNYMWGPSEFSPVGTLVDYENLDALSTVSIPVLFTTGEYDEARPETVRTYVEMVTDAEFVEIPGAGHGSLTDNPAVYIKAHRDFTNRVDGE